MNLHCSLYERNRLLRLERTFLHSFASYVHKTLYQAEEQQRYRGKKKLTAKRARCEEAKRASQRTWIPTRKTQNPSVLHYDEDTVNLNNEMFSTSVFASIPGGETILEEQVNKKLLYRESDFLDVVWW